MEQSQQPQSIRERREAFQSKIFRLMLQVAFIFAIPAALAVWVGGLLDTRYQTDNSIRIALLIAAFVGSWIVIMKLYQKLNKEAHAIDDMAKASKQKNSSKPNSDKE